LACALDSLFQVLDCADDVFALGSTSNIVASELASLSWAKTRRKVFYDFAVALPSSMLASFGFHFSSLSEEFQCELFVDSHC